MLKFINCSRELIGVSTQSAVVFKDITYEQLNQMMEDLLKENGWY